MLGERYPREIVEVLLERAERLREGGKAEVTGAVAAVLGRPARSFRVWAQDHLSAFEGR